MKYKYGESTPPNSLLNDIIFLMVVPSHFGLQVIRKWVKINVRFLGLGMRNDFGCKKRPLIMLKSLKCNQSFFFICKSRYASLFVILTFCIEITIEQHMIQLNCIIIAMSGSIYVRNGTFIGQWVFCNKHRNWYTYPWSKLIAFCLLYEYTGIISCYVCGKKNPLI